MKISRFYQADDLHIDQELELSDDNYRHAIQVLRLKPDDPLIIFNGRGGEYHARIINVEKRKSTIKIDSYDSINRESNLHTSVYLAMIKPDKMDFAIQKMVELGVNEILPMYTKRSVIKVKSNRLEKKIAHWQGVIIAACEQAGRTEIPVICEPKAINSCIEQRVNGNCFVMLPGEYKGISQYQNKIEKNSGVSLLIGPEGGFTTEEEQMVLNNGVTPISFGRRILRAETAAISGLTACQLYWGDLATLK